MSRILIMTLGSRGDIQPFIALGQALQAQGYTVALETSEAYQGFVEAQGVPYAYLNNEMMAMAESDQGRAAVEGGSKMDLIKKVMPMMGRMLQDEWKAAQDFKPDAIVYHPKAMGGYHIAEKLNIPSFISLALPLYTPTSAYGIPVIPALPLGGGFNKFSYQLMIMASAPYSGVVNEFRVNTLGLSKRGRFASELVKTDGSPVPILYSYSPHVLPVPGDYPAHVHVTGYWFMQNKDSWQPAPDLLRFLEAGPTPVYVGFGSMSGLKGQERAQVVIEALAESGQRGVLAKGWGGLSAADLPSTVFMIDQAPHDWLFPQMAAVVHHGGAGTTAAGLRAGKPTVIVPFMVDQPFWGRVVHQLGVGPQPIPQGKLTAAALAGAIKQAANDGEMRRKAEALGVKIRAEDGLGHALRIIGQSVKAGIGVGF